jgi:hypothetical protein
MRLAKVKDKVLESLILDTHNHHSTQLSEKLDVPHHLITAALLEMQKENRLRLIPTSVSGKGFELTYAFQSFDGDAKYFYENGKTYNSQFIWNRIKHFFQYYWAAIAFILLAGINIYQNTLSAKTQKQQKVLELKVNHLMDSIRYLKK